ncbi:MAG: NAD(+) synthase, partial [Sphingomonadales bacterium]
MSKAASHAFYSLHRQGMLRTGVCTPIATAGDPATNAEATIALAKQGDAMGADLLVFPELNVTSYAIDDLHLQDTILDATEAGIAAIVEASWKLKPVLLVGAALRRAGRVYNCAVAIARGRILG